MPASPQEEKGGCGMKTLFRALAGGACGLLIAAMAWLVVEMDNDGTPAGKSPAFRVHA